ncbi:MAG: hypothetical protein V4683_09465 [Bacteroidota bacterium]
MKLKIQAFGITMLLFGSPIIHFFRDFMGVLPKTPLIMPVFSVLFFGMIFITFDSFKRLYKPNFNISVMAWCFLGYSMFLATISDYTRKPALEAFNYAFLIIYFYILCGVHKNVAKEMIPIVILVTLFDNLALLVAFIRNPFTQIGQRAIISDAGWGEGAGNPSLYSFMAFTGIIASIIYFNRAKVIWKIIAIGTVLTSIAVILMTMIRATMITLVLCVLFYLFFNAKSFFKKSKIGAWYNYGFSKSNFILFSMVIFLGIGLLLFINPKILNSLLTYVENSSRTLTHVIDTVFQSGDSKPQHVDPSAANRLTTFNYSVDMLIEDPIKMIYGFGYRFLYVDIPLMQVFLEEGIIGLTLILMFHYFIIKNISLAVQVSNNQWIMLLVYYYLLLLLTSLTRGEPYDPYFWNYFLTIARFLKPEDMIVNFENNKRSGVLLPNYN